MRSAANVMVERRDPFQLALTWIDKHNSVYLHSLALVCILNKSRNTQVGNDETQVSSRKGSVFVDHFTLLNSYAV